MAAPRRRPIQENCNQENIMWKKKKRKKLNETDITSIRCSFDHPLVWPRAYGLFHAARTQTLVFAYYTERNKRGMYRNDRGARLSSAPSREPPIPTCAMRIIYNNFIYFLKCNYLAKCWNGMHRRQTAIRRSAPIIIWWGGLHRENS